MIYAWTRYAAEYLETISSYPGKTQYQYRHAIDRCSRELAAAGLRILPAEISKAEIGHLLNTFRAQGLSVATYSGYVSIFSLYLEYYGNFAVKKMRIIYEQNYRINADWLPPEGAAVLLLSVTDPLERLAVHLELCLGLRRVEVIRLRVQDIKNGFLNIRGKGRGGGKWRSVAMHADTLDVLNAWMEVRRELEDLADPSQRIPDNVIIWEKGGKLSAYAEKGTGYDKKIIHPIRARVPFHFSNHTLRRTFARNMWEAGVEVGVISNILGHDDVQTTIKYIGINMDHQRQGLEKLAKYQEEAMKTIQNQKKE